MQLPNLEKQTEANFILKVHLGHRETKYKSGVG